MHCVEGYMRFVALHIPLILGVKVLHIYLYIYLFIGLSGSKVQLTIVYGVNLFVMAGMQSVVYVKSLKVLAATSCCLLLIAMNRINLSIR